jgi:divalent metal cation (Fe/Co/Zn/Cd) transporter
MKIGVKLLVLWVASMALFISTGIAAWMTMDLMDGVSGLIIRFFLGYCGIIVVAQVFSALIAIRQFLDEIITRKPETVRVSLR